MSFQQLTFIFSFILFAFFIYKWLLSSTKCNTKFKLPPTPKRLPIIGNLHQLGKFPHRSLKSLSRIYGDYMLLYLGNRPTLVVSSATAAEHILKTNDLIFANRPKLRFVNKIFYDGNDIVFNSYGEKWRKMKSICVLKLLTNKRVKSFRTIREEEVGRVIEEIKSYNGSVMNLSEMLMILFKGVISRVALGRKYTDESGTVFYNLFKELVEVLGEVSLGDYIPYLGWIDKVTGLERRADNVGRRFDMFIEEVIQEHQLCLDSKEGGDEDDKEHDNQENFVDVLLQIQRKNPRQLSRENIKAIILDIFGAGTETSSTLLEWTMTELIRQPILMKKIQEEVRSVVNPNKRVTEDDLDKMKYVKAVIKETLRLHPPAPLLAFHESSEDTKINNYDIAARTQVIVNALAIQTNPEHWQNPEIFDPNRFLDDISPSIDFKGQHFQYIPFGSGRRGCPGAAFSIVNVELVLASLVYEFNWTLPNGREGETLDVEERSGITISRRNSLMVIATPTLSFST